MNTVSGELLGSFCISTRISETTFEKCLARDCSYIFKQSSISLHNTGSLHFSTFNSKWMFKQDKHYLPVLSLNSAGLGGGVLDTLGERSSGTEMTTSESNYSELVIRFRNTQFSLQY